MKLKTFNEWRAEGLHVIRGERACGRNEAGVAVFSRAQVTSSEYPMDFDELDYDHPGESVARLEAWDL